MFWNFMVAYIYTVVLTAQGHVLGNLPQGFRWIKPGNEFTLLGPKVPGMPDRPSLGAQVSLCDQSLKHFVRWESPISQSSFGQGLRWWVIAQKLWDQGELPHVHVQHWTHTQVKICHGLVEAQLWLKMSFFYCCTCICAHLYISTCLYPFTTHVNAQICLGKKRHISIYIFFPWHKQNFLSSAHCNQKQNCACLEGL